MNNLICAGFARLRKSAAFRLAVLATAILSVILCFVNYDFNGIIRINMEVMLFIFYALVPLIQAMLIGSILGSEYSDGALRTKLIVGRARREIYFSNLLICTMTTFLMLVLHLGISFGIGFPLFGAPKMPAESVAYAVFCGFLASAAYAAVLVSIGMNCRTKAVSLVISISLVLVLVFFAQYVHAALNEGEMIYEYVQVNGSEIEYGPLVPNPKYLSGIQRSFAELLDDLPFCQLINISNMELNRAARWPVLSAVVYMVSALAGYALFRRKDIQ